MKNKLKNYFNYTSSEKTGTIVLVVLLLLSFSGYWLIDLFKSQSSFNSENLSAEVQEFLHSGNIQTETPVEITYFKFNPNEINLESWMKLGFSEKQATSIIKYREKGGYFYKKEDLKRLYVIDDSLYEVLVPYVMLENRSKYSKKLNTCYFVKLIEDSIPIYDGFSELDKVVCNKREGKYSYYLGGFSNKNDAEKSQIKARKQGFNFSEIVSLSCNTGFVINKKKKSEKFVTDSKKTSNSLRSELSNFKIEVNSTDTTGFKSLRGIGSYYAKKIVKYRSALGGFYSISQLKEVYGIPAEAIDENISRLSIDSLSITKININSCEAVDLKKHPYINWNIANSIVQIRKSHGAYNSVEEITKSDLVNVEIYRKIAPYLKTK